MSHPDPIQQVIDLAQRVLDDAQQVLNGALSAAAGMGKEGTSFAHDTAGVAVSALQTAKDELAKASHAVGRLGK